jgi:methylmalonyl-CoA mutase cobalamin-binding subunit
VTSVAITLKEAKQIYAQEWIAFFVEEEKADVDEIRGQVLDHHRDRREIHRRLREQGVKDAYITFAGPLIRPGYGVMFPCGSR